MKIISQAEYSTQFRAVGRIKGKYVCNDEEEKFICLDGTEIEAKKGKDLRQKLRQKPELIDQINNIELVWRVYPRTDNQGNLNRLELKSFVNNPEINDFDNVLEARGVIVASSPLTKTIAVEIKTQPKKLKPFKIVVREVDADCQVEQFWEIRAIVSKGQLKYLNGTCIEAKYDPTAPRKYYNKKSQTVSLANKETISKQVISNQSLRHQGAILNEQSNQEQSTNIEELTTVMISGRIPELTIKFNTRPDLPETGKKVTLQVTGDNGIVVRATLNRKTLKKQVEKMDSYEQWVGALSGKMSKIAEDGVIELEGAGMNVFEKKSKEKPPATEEEKVAS